MNVQQNGVSLYLCVGRPEGKVANFPYSSRTSGKFLLEHRTGDADLEIVGVVYDSNCYASGDSFASDVSCLYNDSMPMRHNVVFLYSCMFDSVLENCAFL